LAVVWFGWGGIEKTTCNGDDYDNGGGVVTTTTTTENKDGVFSIVVGNGRPPMGLLALSMPPRNVRGVDATAVSSTQLLGGSSEDNMILGHQVSVRLACRVGWPIFVSCSLCGWGGDRGAEGGGGRGGCGVFVNVAGGVRQIRRDLATSRGGTIRKGGIANTPPGEGDALGNDVTLISTMNNTLL
jgi:hypothetical protein